jgi:hypothetical protein
MSLLQDEAGLIALLLGAVLLGIGVIVVAGVLHSRTGRIDPMSEARGIVSQVAATAPTDAHMALGVVVEALRRLLRRFARQ